MSVRQGPLFAKQDYAGFIRRTIALLIDLFLWLFVSAVILKTWQQLPPPRWQTPYAKVWITFGVYCAGIAYFLGMRFTTNGTIGYRIVGIRYAYMFDEKPTITAILFRSFAALFLFWFFALDHFWILIDKRKQAWHDKVAGFYVVKRNAEPQGTQLIVRRIINFMLLSFVVWEPTGDID